MTAKHAARVLSAVLVVLVAVVLSPINDVLASSYAGVVDSDTPSYFSPLEGSTTLDFPSGSCSLAGDTLTGATLVLGGGGSLAGGGSSYGVGCVGGSTSSIFTLGTAFSMEAWFKETTGSGSSCEILVNTWGSNTNIPTICINWGQSNHTIRVDPGAHNCDVPALADGNVHYVAAVFGSGTMSVYYDGQVPATGNNNGACNFTENSSGGAMCWVDAGGGFYQNNNVSTCSNSNNAFCNGGSTPCVSGRAAQAGLSVGETAVYTYKLTGTQVAAHYSARNGGPAAQFAVAAVPQAVKVGATWQFRAQATDSGGADVTSTTTFTTDYAIELTGPAGAVLTCDGHAITLPGTGPPAAGVVTTSFTWSSSTISCHASVAGVYGLDVMSSNLPNTHVQASATVGAVGSSFSIEGIQPVQNQVGVIGQQIAFHGVTLDAQFQEVSGTDSWVWSTVPAGVTCTTPVLGGNPLRGVLRYYSTCTASANGSYTLTGTDSFGFSAQAYMQIGPIAGSAACGSTDLGCWLNQVWNAIQSLAQIPFQILDGLRAFLLVSASGKSFLDLSGIQVLPTITCRGGEVPSAPDGVNCLPFPFSIPAQLGVIWSTLSVSPTGPTITLSLPCGFNVQCTHVVDPTTTVLTPTVMGWVRGVEYVLFVASLGLAVRKYVQLFGVA